MNLLACTAAVIQCLAAAVASAASAQPSLKVSATQFANNDVVRVSLFSPEPTGSDVVALYFEGSDVDKVRPIKWKWAVTSTTKGNWIRTGNGKHEFVLTNSRRNVQFLLMSNVSQSNNKFTSASITARSAVIKNAQPNAPEHGHLARTGRAGEMLIQWTTRDVGSPMVRYGTSAKALTESATASSTTYSAADLCGPPATSFGWADPGQLHAALMTGLKPSRRYYYQYGSAGLFSKVFSFHTAPSVGPNKSVKFIALADLGHAELDSADEYDYDADYDTINFIPDDTKAMASQVLPNFVYKNSYQQGISRQTVKGVLATLKADRGHSLFLLNGDISYARGMQTAWDVFMDQLQPVGTQVPWMLVPGGASASIAQLLSEWRRAGLSQPAGRQGNHDRDFADSGDRFNNATYQYSYDSGGECGVVYRKRFQQPKAPGPQSVAGGYVTRGDTGGSFVGKDITPEWYSYDHGPIHFISYSTEVDFSKGSPQYTFIEADLKAVDRSKTPWIILNGHRPIYTTNAGAGLPYGNVLVAKDLRAALEPLLFEYQVDLTLAGHDHKYERTCPVFKSTCVNYNKDGSAKAPVHLTIGNAGYELSWGFNPFTPSYWRKIAIEHGFMRCKVSAQKLYCQMLSSVTGKQLDAVVLTKPANWKPSHAAQRSFAASFVSKYKPRSTLETTGLHLPSEITKIVYAKVAADAKLLQQIVDINAKRGTKIDHALEDPDTIVDDCEVLKPAIDIIKNMLLKSNTTSEDAKHAARTEVLPQFEAVCKAADNYKKGGGIIYPAGVRPTTPKTLDRGFAAAYRP